MAIYPVGVAAFDSAVLVAEKAWQNAQPFASQTAATTATVTYLTSVIAAGVANNVSVVNQQTALQAIQRTGNP
jgi:hypothetical protein